MMSASDTQGGHNNDNNNKNLRSTAMRPPVHEPIKFFSKTKKTKNARCMAGPKTQQHIQVPSISRWVEV